MPGRHFALRTSHFALALVLAACHPQASRLLLLDERLADPVALESTARPWSSAGYTVEYRRYYPHLTRDDLDRYGALVLLGGNVPEAPSDALTVGDVTVLTEWLLRGGVVVLGYPNGATGSLDRWIMNRWLAWSGAGITIADSSLHDSGGGEASPPALPVRETDVRELGFEPFPAGDYNPLHVAASAQVLARAGGRPARRDARAPVVAARRVGNGLVVVFSRSTLGALAGADQVASQPAGPAYQETRAFLVAVARWTRRPAEWARVPPAAPRAPLALGGEVGVPGPVAPHAPFQAPPPGVSVEVLPSRAPDSAQAHTAVLPAWTARQGIRALAGNLPALDHRMPATVRAAMLDTLSDFLEAGAFTVLLTNARGAALIDSTHWPRWDRDATRAAWEQTADRLDATSVRWIPFVAPRDFATDSGYACPLDPRLWEDVLTPAVRILARLAAAHAEVIPAIGIDLTGTPWAGAAYCDAAWQAGLGELTVNAGFPRDRATRLATLPQSERYDSLLAGGLLAPYEDALERAVARRATGLRVDGHRARSDLLFAVVTDQPPVDWFTRGLIGALGGSDAPVMVFGPDDGFSRPAPHQLHVVRLDPGRFSRVDASLARRVFHGRDGFWLAPAEALLGGTAQDLIHQLRRFAKDR